MRKRKSPFPNATTEAYRSRAAKGKLKKNPFKSTLEGLSAKGSILSKGVYK